MGHPQEVLVGWQGGVLAVGGDGAGEVGFEEQGGGDLGDPTDQVGEPIGVEGVPPQGGIPCNKGQYSRRASMPGRVCPTGKCRPTSPKWRCGGGDGEPIA